MEKTRSPRTSALISYPICAAVWMNIPKIQDELYPFLRLPAEGLSGRFVKIDKEKYGIIEGVTDRDYYTNSFHIPVYYPISAFKKIQLEAPLSRAY